MKKACDTLYHVAKILILTLISLILLYFFFLAGFSTSILNQSESTLFLDDSIVRNLLAAVVALVTGCLFVRIPQARAWIDRINNDRAFSDRCRWTLLAVIGALALVFVLSLRNTPMNDQLMIMSDSGSWLYHNYDSLHTGGYGYLNHNQLGIILILYFTSQIVGPFNYMAFKVCNVIALVTLYKGLSDLSDLTGHSHFEGFIMILAGGLFASLTLYTGFVYSILIGLSSVLNAVKYLLHFEQTHKIRYVVFFTLLLFFGCRCKEQLP